MDVKEEARKWIDDLQAGGGLYGSWRLQVLEQKTRVVDRDSGGDVMKQSPVRLRRFAKGIPRPLVDAAIRYLVSLAPYEGVLYDGVPCEGRFVPVRTRWVRDDDISVERNRADNRYTIIQDLVEIGELDSLGVTTSESCSEVTTTEYVWDAASVGELPIDGAFSQGTTVSVQGVSRDADGNISYAVVTRTAKTTVTGPTVQECDEFGTVTVTVWDNVYGEGTDDDPFRADTDRGADDDSLGIKRRTPPCDHGDGTIVTENVTRNEDCTYRIVHTEKSSNMVVTEHSMSSTIYEKVESDTTRATDVGGGIHVVPDAPDSAAGTVNDVKVELRPDGKYDVVDRTRTENSVDGSSVETRKTLRGVRTTTKSRSQIDPVTGSGEGGALRIGEYISNTKTDSGRYDTVHETVGPESVGTIQADHRGTIFKDSAGVRRNENESYFKDSDGVVTFDKDGRKHDVDDGVITDVSSTATEEGTFDNDRTVTTEHNREYAEIEYVKTLKASRKSVTHRNRSRLGGKSPVDDNVSEDSVMAALVDADGVFNGGKLSLSVGDRVRLTRTDGDRVDVVLGRVDMSDPVGVIGATSQPTEFEIVNTVTGNYPSMDAILDAMYPGGIPADFDIDGWNEFMSLGGSGTFELPSKDGSLKSISVQMTEEGTYDVTVTTKTARGDGNGTTWNEQISTPWEYKYTVHFRNVSRDRLYDVLGNFDDITCRQYQPAAYRYDGQSTPGMYDTNRVNSHRRLLEVWDSGDRLVTRVGPGYASEVVGPAFITSDRWSSMCPWTETMYSGPGSGAVKPAITVDGQEPNFSQVVSWKLSKWFSGHVDDFFASYRPDATLGKDAWVTCIVDHSCPPSSHDVSVSLSVNDYGYLDGSASFTAKWSPESPGQDAVLGEGVYFAYRMGNALVVSGRGFSTLINVWNYQYSFVTTIISGMKKQVKANVEKNFPVEGVPAAEAELNRKRRALFDGYWNTAGSYRLLSRGSSLSFDPVSKTWHATINAEGNMITSVKYRRMIEQDCIDYLKAAVSEMD